CARRRGYDGYLDYW
nr:immunoglobulin heavy chain junction region [Mus musculus]